MEKKLDLTLTDLIRIKYVAESYGCKYFTIIKHAQTAIGCLIDIEFKDENGNQWRVPVITYSDW